MSAASREGLCLNWVQRATASSLTRQSPHPNIAFASHSRLNDRRLRTSAAVTHVNITNPCFPVKSSERISKEDDQKMNIEVPSNGHVEPGISIRMGPVDDMEVDAPATNGNANGKRKARNSVTNGKSYKDASGSEDDDKPLVSATVNLLGQNLLMLWSRASDDGLPRRSYPKTTPNQNSATCL